jgi:galactokinase
MTKTSPFDETVLLRAFQEAYGGAPRLFRSPGRINLIGEHTDYNEGFVMPAAIDAAVYVALAPRSDGRIRLRSTAFPEAYEGHVSDLSRSSQPWANYVLGVLAGLEERGFHTSGFDALFDSDLPLGAGLSSSAALSCATVFGLDALHGFGVSRADMVDIARLAEHRYAGVMCGIMDPFASLFGRQGHFIRLDCRSREHAYVPFLAEGYSILLLDTNVKHSLASSAYNRRREECAQGLEWVRAQRPEVSSLRDVDEEMLDRHVAPRDSVVDRRCRYVVRENRRLLALCEDLQRGALSSAGMRMFETHAGLRDMYEVSCPEADFLVEQARAEPAVLGARMMGGGFGGCTINLVRTELADTWVSGLQPRYEDAFGLSLRVLTVDLSDGTRECQT